MHQFQPNNGGHDRGIHSGNGVFQTSLDFDKTKALLNLSKHFPKITYHQVYLDKI